MEKKAKQKLEAYLAAHPYLQLATLTPGGTPLAHTVAYASEGAVVYFGTHKDSRKIENIRKNPRVAYTVDEDYTELPKIQGIQMEGKATILTKMADVEKAGGLMNKKFGAMDIPHPNEMLFVRIDPIEAYFIDNTVEFGHRDKVTY